MPYETVEHTADIGLRITAQDLKGLFRDAAEGFFELVTDLRAIKGTDSGSSQEIEIDFREEDAPGLFMRWLQEILFMFSARKLVLTDPDFIRLTSTALTAKAKGVRFDPRVHPSRHEIKAVTYHRFRVAETASGWEAEVIFDI